MNNPFEEINARLSNIESLILDIKHKKDEDKHSDSDKLLTIKELLEILPERPAKQTVYGWVCSRKIPFEKYGSKLYFKKSIIEVWLNNGRKFNYLK